MTELLHPMAYHAPKTIDVFYGGNERETLDESAKLAFDCVKHLPKNEHVLYVNTLESQRSFEKTMKRFASRRPRLLYVTWLESSFMLRLKFLEKMIKSQNVGTLVLNSFECAALTQRHRVELGQWVRRIRNLFDIRIIIFMQCRPGYYGVNGSLRFAANYLTEVGDYRKELNGEFGKQRLEREAVVAKEFEIENTTPLEAEVAEVLEPEVKQEESPVLEAPVIEGSIKEESVEEEMTEVEASEEEVGEDVTWMSLSTDEELETMLDWFGGDFTDEGAHWLIEEIEKRISLGTASEKLVRAFSLKYKELEVADVV